MHQHQYLDKGTKLFTCHCGFHTESAAEFKTHAGLDPNVKIVVGYDPAGELRQELRKGMPKEEPKKNRTKKEA